MQSCGQAIGSKKIQHRTSSLKTYPRYIEKGTPSILNYKLFKILKC